MKAGTGGHGAGLRAQDVTIHYWLERSNSAFLAVDGVNLDIHAGEFLSIVGASGCGKSTFLNAIDGLLPISGGSLTLNGRAITRPTFMPRPTRSYAISQMRYSSLTGMTSSCAAI